MNHTDIVGGIHRLAGDTSGRTQLESTSTTDRIWRLICSKH